VKGPNVVTASIQNVKKTVSGEGLSRNWMVLLDHRMLQYIGGNTKGWPATREEP
jgi:hypothetical protein